jgi:ERCC4-type nuclease
MQTTWIVERTLHRRFRFRISLEQYGRVLAAFRTQAAWPGPGQQVFCLREQELDPAEALESMERVPVVQLSRLGRKLSVVLDRPNRKRCEFLSIQKPAADGSGTIEQVFLRTERGIRAHRSGGRVELRAMPDNLEVVIDSTERYPWTFPGATVTRRKLASGDYALVKEGLVLAAVERKTLDNLLGEVGKIQGLHHQLSDLTGLPHAALVIEAEYRDFLNPRKMAGRWKPEHLGRVLAELAALHPTLPIIYAGNRKAAAIWTHNFFLAIARTQNETTPQLTLDVEQRYDSFPRSAGIDERIRHAALAELPRPFVLKELQALFADVPVSRIRRVLGGMVREGILVKSGRGEKAAWI